MIKAIVLDIDGTLVNSNGTINDLTRNTLIKAQQDGLHVIIASGRPTPSVFDVAKEIGLDKFNGHIISFNGAHVMNFTTRETLFEQPLRASDAKEVLTHLENFDVVPMVCIGEYMYVEDVFSGFIHHKGEVKNVLEFESRIGNYKLCEVDRLVDFIKCDIYKVLITGEPDYLTENLNAFKEPFVTSKTITRSADYFVEFVDAGVDKAKALQHVLDIYGLTRENTIAFGDGMNDATLLEFAGIGVAMDNAVPELKAKADHITLSNDDDGIVAGLKYYNII